MLYIWMPEGQAQWSWSTDGVKWQVEPTLDQLIQQAKSHHAINQSVVVFFPSQTAHFESKILPRQQYKQLRAQGLQYLIEDNSIESVDQLSFFYHYTPDQLNIMAMPHYLRETYQNTMALLPWRVAALLPDFLLAPVPNAQELVVTQFGDQVIWRWGVFEGWQSTDFSLMDLFVGKIEQVKAYGLSAQHEVALKAHLTSHDIDLVSENLAIQDLSKLQRHPFNALLKIKTERQGFSYWKACAALLAVAIITQVTYDSLRWWKYKQLADQTAQLAVSQYQQWYPQETRVNESNLASQFNAKVRAHASADVQVLNMMSQIGPLVQQSQVQAQQVSYQDNQLTLSLLAQNAQVLNQLNDQLKQQGFNAELGAIRNEGQKVLGMIKVQ